MFPSITVSLAVTKTGLFAWGSVAQTSESASFPSLLLTRYHIIHMHQALQVPASKHLLCWLGLSSTSARSGKAWESPGRRHSSEPSPRLPLRPRLRPAAAVWESRRRPRPVAVTVAATVRPEARVRRHGRPGAARCRRRQGSESRRVAALRVDRPGGRWSRPSQSAEGPVRLCGASRIRVRVCAATAAGQTGAVT